MSPTIGLPPPYAERCLDTSRVSRFNGGTLVAEDVHDLEEHRRRMNDGDAYRPGPCPRCGHATLHVHCRPERHPWKAVERVVRPRGELRRATAPPVPETTERRWRARLSSSARVLCALLMMSGGAELTRVSVQAGLDATRGELVDAFDVVARSAPGEGLAPLAGLLNRPASL
jgi:hypothetical protein